MSTDASTQPAELEHAYGNSAPYSIGVEEEFQLLHRETFELTSRIDAVLGHASDHDRRTITPELMQSVVEGCTTICANAEEALADLTGMRKRIIELADKSDCVIGSAGTHPFSRYEFQKVTDHKRYQDIISRLQWVAQRELIYGLHVHVGIETPEKAVAIFNAARVYVPHLLVLAANSPFWQGRHTGLYSSRVKIFDSFPRSGLPPVLDSWASFSALMRRAVGAGCFPDHTYIWWDIRPHPGYGTIEFRICDAQSRVGESAALAAVVQALCAWLGELHDEGRPMPDQPTLLIEENKWRATRYGLQGDLIDFADDATRPARPMITELLTQLEPYAAQLGSATQFAAASQLVEENGALRQLERYKDSESLLSVAEMLAELTMDV